MSGVGKMKIEAQKLTKKVREYHAYSPQPTGRWCGQVCAKYLPGGNTDSKGWSKSDGTFSYGDARASMPRTGPRPQIFTHSFTIPRGSCLATAGLDGTTEP